MLALLVLSASCTVTCAVLQCACVPTKIQEGLFLVVLKECVVAPPACPLRAGLWRAPAGVRRSRRWRCFAQRCAPPSTPVRATSARRRTASSCWPSARQVGGGLLCVAAVLWVVFAELLECLRFCLGCCVCDVRGCSVLQLCVCSLLSPTTSRVSVVTVVWVAVVRACVGCYVLWPP